MSDLLTALAFLAASSHTHYEEYFFGYGVGVANSAKNSSTEVKTLDLGYRVEVYNGIYWQAKAGFWGDGSGDPTRKSSFYLSTGPSLLVDLNPIELRSGWSLAGITSPDSYLGGAFPQFNGELYLGVRDRYGNGTGVKYQHFSSAGIYQPNVGRDFLMMELSLKW
jgi:hypothetical protein